MLIYDTGTSRCLLKESSTFKSTPGGNVLGVLEGPCSDFSKETRNKNFYSKRLWENVLSSDYVKESLDTHTLFGSLDHPENLDNFASDAAVCCTKLWIDEANDCLMGTFDVLPTVKGKILDSLLKYGSILGVSSRGVGDLTPMPDGVQRVEEDNYLFVCFDVVTQPAAIKARQNYKSLTESVKPGEKSILETLIESIHAANSEQDINSVLTIASKLGLEKNKKLTESVENVKSNLKKNNKYSTINLEVLSNDLENAYKKIALLEDTRNGTTSILASLEAQNTQIVMMRRLIETYQTDQTKKSKKSDLQMLSLMESLLESQKVANTNFLDMFTKTQKAYNDNLNLIKESLSREVKKVNGYKEKNEKLIESLKYSVGFVDKCKDAISQRDVLIEKLKGDNVRLNEANQRIISQPNNTKQNIQTSDKKDFLDPKIINEYAKSLAEEYKINLSEAMPEINRCRTKSEVLDVVQKKAIRLSESKKVSVMDAYYSNDNTPVSETTSSDSLNIIRAALKQGREK